MALARSLHHMFGMRNVFLILALFAIGHTLVAVRDARADRRTLAPKNPADGGEINRLVPIEDAETLRIKAKRRLYAERCILGRIEKVETALDEALLHVICNRRAAGKYPLKTEERRRSNGGAGTHSAPRLGPDS